MQNEHQGIPLRLLRLISSQLPVGAFAYSRGLEFAASTGLVTARIESVSSWIFGTLEHSFAQLDGALFLRLVDALNSGATQEFLRFDNLLSASRESREFLLEDRRMAEALVELSGELHGQRAGALACECKTFPAAFALAVHNMEVPAETGLRGLMWSYCEAQVSAAIRLGLIGQVDGQRILMNAPQTIESCLRCAVEASDDDIGNVSFMQAIGSAMHETQYSRLFRS